MKTQWLFEAPIETPSVDLEIHSEYLSNSELESEWEYRENHPYDVFSGNEEWESPPIALPGFRSSELKALRITTTFETGRPLGFGGLTGNFDGMGLSFGLLQWNIGSGSLQPLLQEFARHHPQQFQAVFGQHAAQLRQVLQQSKLDQMRFARSINDTKNRIVQPWAGYFRLLETNPTFQQIQLSHVRPRMNKAIQYAKQFQLRSERGLALMFDIVTQSGSAWLQKKNRAALIQQRQTAAQQQLERSLTEREVLSIIANVVADTSASRWREDVRVRKLTIVTGRGTVHKRQFDLARDFGLTDQPWETGSRQSSPVSIVPTQSTSFKQRVQTIALKEWEFFNRGKKKENQDGAWQRIGNYWKEGVGLNLDGRNPEPWSAAFVSWVMKKAGAGNKFKYAAGHSVYIRDAIKKRKDNDTQAAFKAYRLHEVAPQVGDLVCTSRAKDAGKVGYDTTRSYASHCDIVVATRPGEIDVIGGNVGNSVGKKTLKIDSQGKLIQPGHWFAVIKNLL